MRLTKKKYRGLLIAVGITVALMIVLLTWQDMTEVAFRSNFPFTFSLGNT